MPSGINIPIRLQNELSAGLDQASVDLKKFADTAVATNARAIESLRLLEKQYGVAAASAKAGSAEQVSALKLQADAQRKLAVQTGELTRGQAFLGTGFGSVGKKSEELRGRLGGLLGSVKSLAFGFGGLAAGFGVYDLFKNGIDNAEQLERAHRSLKVSIDSLGGSYRQVGPEITKWADGQAQLGVSVIDAEQGFSRLIPMVGGAKKALEAYHLALILSKGAGIDLSAAERAVAKALDGKTTSLQRYGIVLEKGATAEQAATAIQQRYAGQAVANTTATDKLKASVSNMETEIGQALLPTLQHWVDKISDWLNKSDNQKRVVDDVKQAIHDLGEVVKTATGFVEGIDKVTGGFKHTLELLLALTVAAKIAGWTGSLTKFSSALGGESGAVTRSGALLGNLRNLARIGALTIGVDLLFQTQGRGAKGLLGAILTGATLGAGAGGPIGALLGGAGALTIDVLLRQAGKQAPPPPAERLGLSGAESAGIARSIRRAAHVRVGEYQDQLFAAGDYLVQEGYKALGNAFKQLATKLAKEGAGAVVSKQQAAAINKRFHGAGNVGGGSSSGVVATAQFYGTGTGGGIYGENLQQAGMAPAPNREQILDCSSYVFEVFTRAGFKDFPDVSTTQWQKMSGPNWTSQTMGVGSAEPGDVVFYNVPGGEGPAPNHVGIVVSGGGNSARVMQYYSKGRGAAIFGIIAGYPIMGVKRFHLIKKSAGAGSGGADGSGWGGQRNVVAAGSSSSGGHHKKTDPAAAAISAILAGSAHAQNTLTRAEGGTNLHHILAAEKAVLHSEQSEAHQLRGKITHSSGKARQEYRAALDKVEKELAETQKAISRTVVEIAKKAHDALVKRLDKIETAADKQFEAQMAPLQKQLDAMQAQDVVNNDAQNIADAQDALNQALMLGDPDAVKQAQEALDQANRQQTEDQLQAQIDKIQKNEDDFNASIEDLAANAATAASALGSVAKLLASYGITVPGFSDGSGSGSGGSGGSGGGGGGVPPPRAFATGGIVRRPVHALIGEKGPEAVIPLDDPRARSLGGGQVTVNVHIDKAIGSDLRKAAQELAPEIRRELLRVRGRNANTLGF